MSYAELDKVVDDIWQISSLDAEFIRRGGRGVLFVWRKIHPEQSEMIDNDEYLQRDGSVLSHCKDGWFENFAQIAEALVAWEKGGGGK